MSLILKRTILSSVKHPAVQPARNIFLRQVKPKKTRLNQIIPKVPIEIIPPNGVSFNVYNRNPRNLEKLRIAYKNEGWPLEKPGKTYWNKLVIKEDAKRLEVGVLHMSGKIVISASTEEWCIRKHLYKGTDKAAYFNIGRIFARRCVESGLTEMMSTYVATDSPKIEVLIREIENGGITLSEADRLQGRDPNTQIRPEMPWDLLE